MISGVDISAIQGVVDFIGLKNSGVEFVIFRCFVGNGGKDKFYDQNVAKARSAGLKVAAYHFVYPLPPLGSQPTRDPKIQAKMHADAAGDVSVICCDLEWPVPQDWNKWGCSAAQIVEWVTTYLQEYERLSGVRPIVYTYPNFAQSIHLPESFAETYKLWIASYTHDPVVPAPWKDWVLWQDSGGTQKLPNGVPVDTDKARDLSLWGAAAPVVPPPAPAQDPASVPVPDPVPAPVVPPPAPVVPAPAPQQSNLFTLLFGWVGWILKLLGRKA